MAEHKKIILHEGGSRSSKTWSIFQFFILKALQGEKLTITIAREKLQWAKITLLKDFADLCEMYQLPVTPQINPKAHDQVYKIYNVEFGFFGFDNPRKLHGRKQDWTWLNEVMEIGLKEYNQVRLRTTQGMILDYNPYDDSHWVFNLQLRDDVGVIKSTHWDNPFLEQTIIDEIMAFEPTPENIAKGTADQYMWDVYGKGNKARLLGVIFTNWDTVESVPETARFLGYGLDFGYSNDPTALVAGYIQDNEVYLHELIYEKGLTNDDIAARMELLLVEPGRLIVGDSSEPKSIEEIYRKGFHGIQSVEKGPDSVNFGLSLMKTHKIHLTKQSINLESEFRKYKWAEDKTGRSLNKPIDMFNHAIDAARYLTMTTLQAKEEVIMYPAGLIG